MGGATTRAAQDRGLSVDYTAPAGYTSEDVFKKIVESWENIDTLSVLILTGEGGRDFLAKALRQRGAQVEVMPLYRRCCPDYSDAELEEIFRSCLLLSRHCEPRRGEAIQSISITSNESLDNLLKIISNFSLFDLEAALDLKQQKLIVPSERVRRHALSQGFSHVLMAASAREEDLGYPLFLY